MDYIRFFWDLSSYLGRGILLCNVLTWVIAYWRYPHFLQVLGVFLVIDLITEFAATEYARAYQNNLPLLHIYTVLEFVLLTWFYSVLDTNNFILKRWKVGWTGVVMTLLILNSLLLQPIYTFNSYAKSTVQIIIISYAIGYFFNIYGKIDLTQRVPFSQVLINSGILIYYSGSLFIFMFSEWTLRYWTGVFEAAYSGMWMLNSLLFFTFQIIILIAQWRILLTRIRF
jgi:hypothetical protein